MNKSLSAQIVPLLVLIVAILGVSSYVFDHQPNTEVKTSIEALLPNQTPAEFGGMAIRYPADWRFTDNGGAFLFSPEEDPTTTIAVTPRNTTVDEYIAANTASFTNIDIQPYCMGDICGYTWPANFEGSLEANLADAFDLQSYIMPVGNNQLLQFDLQTPPGEGSNHQEILAGMIRTAEIKPFVAQTLDVPPFASVVLPADWQSSIQPIGESGFQSASLSQGTGNLALFPVTMEFVPDLFSVTLPEGGTTPDVVLQTVLATVPETDFIQPQGPVTIGNHSGSMAVLLNNGNSFEIGVLAIGDAHALVYSLETTSDAFDSFRTASYAIIGNVQWNVPGAENVSSGTTEDSAPASTNDDRIPNEPEGIATDADGNTSGEGDTSSDVSSTDTADTGNTDEPVQVEVNAVVPLPLGEAFFNEATGLSVAVPEGFTARGDSNFTYLTQGTDSLRYFVGTADDIATRIGIETPAEGTPNGLLTAFITAEAGSYDEVTSIFEFGNYAYVDATRGSSTRRFAVAELADGQLVYIEAKATASNFAVFGATTLATIQTLTIGEAPATDTSGDTSDATDASTDTPEVVEVVVAPELTETATGTIITSVQYPADWTATVGPMGTTPFENAELANDTSFINIIPVPMELMPLLFQLAPPAEGVTPESVLSALAANMPATTQLVEGVTPIAFGDYSGDYIVVSAEGRNIEIGILQIGETAYGIVYTSDMDTVNFATVHATTQAVLATVEVNLDALANSNGEGNTSDTTDTSADAPVEDTASQDTADATDTSADAPVEDTASQDTADATDTSADAPVEDTASQDTADATDTSADAPVEDTASATALPLGDTFTNEELGLTVNVPEGFNPRGDSNYLYVDQISTSIRFAVGSVEEVTARLGLELENYPNEDIAVNLMTLFAADAEESGSYDSVSAVTVNDNGQRAYVDVSRSSTKRRFLVMELEDGRLLYVEAKARTTEFDVMSATTTAMIQSMTIAEPVTE